jgi:hypothetical protein
MSYVVDVDVVDCAVVQSFLDVFLVVQEVGGVPLLKRMFDVQANAPLTIRQVK